MTGLTSTLSMYKANKASLAVWLLRAKVAAEWLSLKRRLLGLVVGRMLPSPICTPSVWQASMGGFGVRRLFRLTETASPELIQMTANWTKP